MWGSLVSNDNSGTPKKEDKKQATPITPDSFFGKMMQAPESPLSLLPRGVEDDPQPPEQDTADDSNESTDDGWDVDGWDLNVAEPAVLAATAVGRAAARGSEEGVRQQKRHAVTAASAASAPLLNQRQARRAERLESLVGGVVEELRSYYLDFGDPRATQELNEDLNEKVSSFFGSIGPVGGL